MLFRSVSQSRYPPRETTWSVAGCTTTSAIFGTVSPKTSIPPLTAASELLSFFNFFKQGFSLDLFFFCLFFRATRFFGSSLRSFSPCVWPSPTGSGKAGLEQCFILSGRSWFSRSPAIHGFRPSAAVSLGAGVTTRTFLPKETPKPFFPVPSMG